MEAGRNSVERVWSRQANRMSFELDLGSVRLESILVDSISHDRNQDLHSPGDVLGEIKFMEI